MTLTLEYNSHAPGVTKERLRSDFEAIWQKNVVEVSLIKRSDTQAGDYFHEGESQGLTTTKIFLNIQGSSSDHYTRQPSGISTTGAIWKAYARWFENIGNLDVIIWNGKRFIVEEFNKSYHEGNIIFQEMNLKRVDKL